MANFYPQLTEKLCEFILQQHMFFVATAPAQGRVNVSPKGMDTLRIIDDQTVAYLDLTGSGNETSAHIRENQRITLMLCSFEKQPMILRLYGKGEVLRPAQSQFDHYASLFPTLAGTRQVILIHIESVQTSCGFAVPFYDFAGHRPLLQDWAVKKGEQGIQQYWQDKNQTSIDGLETGMKIK